MEQYDVLAPIAAALFGRVDLCRHRASGAVVAVKRMELSFAGRRRAKDTNAAVHEDVYAELSANLKVQALGGHRFVLPMTDCFVDREAVHLVLAHCPRGELLTVVNATRAGTTAPLDTRCALRYFKQVLLAAAFLHANGIAHRDLSLENVLVDERGDCQVCDFGLATSAASVPATPVGKVHYMAPEACATPETEAQYDPIAADVWSLGVMLFAMLAGRYPFREPMRRDDHFRLLEDFGVAYLLAKLDVDTDSAPGLADLLAQCFVVDPSARPSAATLLQHRALADIDVDCASAATATTNQEADASAACDATVLVSASATTTTPTTTTTTTIGALQAPSVPLRPESSSGAHTKKQQQQQALSSSSVVLAPVSSVSTIHPATKRALAASVKELELSQPEVAASSASSSSSSAVTSATAAKTKAKALATATPRRELVQRAFGKMFRKAATRTDE